jgi:hypothetical protein
MKKQIRFVSFALALVAGAFAQVVPPPVPPAPDAAIVKERDDLKAQFENLKTVAQNEITRLTVLAERNELAYKLRDAAQENLALRNALAAEQAKSAELQSRYDMEKAKVEAMLKKHPNETVRADKPASTMPPEAPAKK